MRIGLLAAFVFAFAALSFAQNSDWLRPAQPLTEPGPLERQSRRLASFETLRSRQTPLPESPKTDSRSGAEYRMIVVFVVDKDGHLAEARVDYFEATTPPGSTARSDALSAVSVAVQRAVRQWQFEPPFAAPVKHVVGFRFTVDGRFESWDVPSDLRFRVRPAEPSFNRHEF